MNSSTPIRWRRYYLDRDDFSFGKTRADRKPLERYLRLVGLVVPHLARAEEIVAAQSNGHIFLPR